MDISLMKGDLMSFKSSLKGAVVRCVEGVIWVTVAGDGKDHILTKGAELPILTRGKVVMSAEKASTVRFYRPIRVETYVRCLSKTTVQGSGL